MACCSARDILSQSSAILPKASKVLIISPVASSNKETDFTVPPTLYSSLPVSLATSEILFPIVRLLTKKYFYNKI